MDSTEPGTERLPWRLRAAALIFVIGGASGTASMVPNWLRGVAHISLSPLVIWLGVSLLKRSDGARFWGLVLSWLVVIGTALIPILVLAAGLPLQMEVPGKFTLILPTWTMVPLLALNLFLSGWMIAALRRLKREGAFRSVVPPGTRLDPRSRRHVIAAMTVGVALTIAEEVLIHSIPAPTDSFSVTGSDDRRLLFVGHGTRFGKLAYVVFQQAAGSLSPPIDRDGPWPGKAYLKRPDSTRLLLPGESQLYEIADGELRTSDRRVTLDEFKAFQRSSPDEYTIDALLRFVGGSTGGD